MCVCAVYRASSIGNGIVSIESISLISLSTASFIKCLSPSFSFRCSLHHKQFDRSKKTENLFGKINTIHLTAVVERGWWW